MPSINLLDNSNQSKSMLWIPRVRLGKLLAALSSCLLVLIICMYWAVVWQKRSIVTKIENYRVELQALEAEVIASPERRELLVRQGQLKELRRLLEEYPQWSRLLPELARITLKSGSYINVSATSEDKLHMSVVLPSYAEFDKFMQIFDQTQYNTNIYNARVVAANKFESSQRQGVRAEVEADIRPEFLRALKAKETR